MNNLINELQVSAERDDVLTVLRKTKRLASKLGREDIAEWLRAEQTGYSDDQAVPDYRQINARLAYNTNGYIPAGFGQLMSGVVDVPSSGISGPIPLIDSISTIINMIESVKAGNGIYFPVVEGTKIAGLVRSLYRVNPMVEHQISFLLHLNESQIKAIPEQIKDKVLDWACALEAAGVTGDGLTFSAKEKEIAHAITFNLNNCNVEQLNNLGNNFRGNQ